MPCRDDAYNPREESFDRQIRQQERLDLATRVACTIEKLLTEKQIKSLPGETQQWIANHREMDRRRLERENEEKLAKIRKQKIEETLATLRKQALKKLNPAERKALGL
jgi:hypothetical protein